MFRRFPSALKPWLAQAGVEYLHGRSYSRARLRPLAAADFKKRQEGGWGRTDVSVRAGVQLENFSDGGRRCMLLPEYYKGRDPNGQFYVRSIEEWGAGIQFRF